MTEPNSAGSDGARERVAEWYDAHGASLYRFALHMTRRPEDAEDVVVETMLVAMRAEPPGEAREVRNWLFAIAVNQWRNHRRKFRPWSALEAALVAAPPPGETRIDVWNALRRLDPAKREAFVLVKIEGFTTQEAARLLGRPHGTVMTQVHVAMKRLQSWLDLENPPRTVRCPNELP